MHMPERRIFPWLLVAASLFWTGSAFGAEPVTVSGAWIRLLPVDVPLAGYLTLHNHGKAPLELVAATSPAFKRIELHHSMTMQGMDKMTPVQSVTIPPGGKFQFKPGDYHLMMWRKHPLAVGDRVSVTLKFSDGGSVTKQFTVKGPTQ